jgi:carbon-monoxide dehydrogenase medium subunit
MKPAPFSYHDPADLDELCGLLADMDDTKILAGGQCLVPMLNLRYALPEHVIDINNIPDLSFIRSRNGSLHIGALTRQKTLLSSGTIADRCPVMAEALRHVGHFQTRNRGTLGGSLCHLDPAAELPAIARLLDAEFEVKSKTKTRTIAAVDWFQGYMTPNLAPDEFLVSIDLPVWQTPYGYAFEEFARRHGDFAIVAAGAMIAAEQGIVSQAAICVAGADVMPQRLTDLEKALVGARLDDEIFAEAAQFGRAVDAMSDAYVTAAYRKRLSGVLVERAVRRAAAGIEGHGA